MAGNGPPARDGGLLRPNIPDQAVRREALDQAIRARPEVFTTEGIIETAKAFEKFLRGEGSNDAGQ